MVCSLRSVVAGAVVGVAALLTSCPAASADPWAGCGPHSLEDQVVRVFPRTPSAAGPTGDSSALQCGNRYFGFDRIEAEWSAAPGGDWQNAADAAIARTLTTDRAPRYDLRSDTWTFVDAGTTVVTGPHGLIIDARPA